MSRLQEADVAWFALRVRGTDKRLWLENAIVVRYGCYGMQVRNEGRVDLCTSGMSGDVLHCHFREGTLAGVDALLICGSGYHCALSIPRR